MTGSRIEHLPPGQRGKVGLTPDYRALLRNASWNYLGYFFEAAVNLALVAYIVRRVGVVDYGIYLFALSLAEQVGLLEFGLPSILSQTYIAEGSRSGLAGVSRLISTAFSFSVLLGAAALSACLGLAALLPGPFHISAAKVLLGREALVLAGAWMFLIIPTAPLQLVFESWHRFDTLNKIQMLLGVLRAVATVGLLEAGYGILALMWVQVGLAGVRPVLLWALMPAQTGGLRLNLLLWDWSRLRPVLRSARWASLDGLLWRLGMRMDLLIVSVLVSMRGVAIYGVGSKLPVYLSFLVGRGVNVIFPALAEHHTGGDLESLQRLFVTTCRLALTALFPIVLTLVVFADTVVQVWVGAQYEGAATVMRWLLIAALVEGVAAPADRVLYARDQARVAARISVVENLFNFGLSCLLVFPFGLAGPAVGSAVARVLGSLRWVAAAACRAAELAPKRLASILVKDNGVPALVSSLGLSLVWYFSRGLPPLGRLFSGVLAGTLLYLGAWVPLTGTTLWRSRGRAAE